MKKKTPLQKLLSGVYMRKDIDKLEAYVNTEEGEKEFQELSQLVWKESLGLDLQTGENDVTELLPELDKKRKQKRLIPFLAVAASIVMLFAIGFQLYTTSEDMGSEIRAAADVINVPDDSDIKLILSNGEPVDVSGDSVRIKHDKSGKIKINEEDLVYNQVDQEKETNKYNTLIVPKGKRSTLQLSDDVFIWVNAGSNVIYPADIATGKREIFVEGEVFVYVQPQTDESKKRPFTVRTRNMNVEVTGTQFNVSAYTDDITESVVLVSGSVNVNTTDRQKGKLSPNKQLTYTKDKGLVITDVNVLNYVSWKDGFYQFSKEPLGEILKRLSRYYGANIEISTEASKLVCSGRLILKDNLLHVFEGLSYTAPIEVEKHESNKYLVTLKNGSAYDKPFN